MKGPVLKRQVFLGNLPHYFQKDRHVYLEKIHHDLHENLGNHVLPSSPEKNLEPPPLTTESTAQDSKRYEEGLHPLVRKLGNLSKANSVRNFWHVMGGGVATLKQL